MILVERELYDMGGEATSNIATDLHTYFGCVVPKHIGIHPPPTSVTKRRGKRMRRSLSSNHICEYAIPTINLFLMTIEISGEEILVHYLKGTYAFRVSLKKISVL